MARPRIPSRVELPFGYVIRVNQTSVKHMRKIAAPHEDPVALWDDSKNESGGTIWLLRSRKRKEKLDDFGHEMIHAVNDWMAWMLGREA